MKQITFTDEQLSSEVWRDVKGFEGHWQVSTIGRVQRRTGTGWEINMPALVIRNRYAYVTLQSPDNYRQTSVHRLVAETFLPNNDESKSQVNHKDGNTAHNSVDNLEWVSPCENIQHSIQTGLRQTKYRKQVKCLDTGELLGSLADAARMCGTDTTRIVESINCKSCCKGLTFVYPGTVTDEAAYLAAARAKYQPWHKKPEMPNSCPVVFVETGEEFTSLKDASRRLGCDPMTIKSHCKTGRPYKNIHMKFK